ncbi:MAG TPA: hypothetical protein VMH80_04385 [Bryobacteraceae bacterium]|nr:hypothetical protein [Bryobacteraceae bacterium]
MAQSDQAFFEQVTRRITWLILVLGVLGGVGVAFAKGIRNGLAFLLGASVSYFSFWGWQRLVDALTPGAKPKTSRFFILRILLLAAAAYAIIKFLGLNVAVAVTGLLVSAAAVILELIYELIYART